MIYGFLTVITFFNTKNDTEDVGICLLFGEIGDVGVVEMVGIVGVVGAVGGVRVGGMIEAVGGVRGVTESAKGLESADQSKGWDDWKRRSASLFQVGAPRKEMGYAPNLCFALVSDVER